MGHPFFFHGGFHTPECVFKIRDKITGQDKRLYASKSGQRTIDIDKGRQGGGELKYDEFICSEYIKTRIEGQYVNCDEIYAKYL
jgi:hypothetical protein